MDTEMKIVENAQQFKALQDNLHGLNLTIGGQRVSNG
jgi:hypothetical protein